MTPKERFTTWLQGWGITRDSFVWWLIAGAAVTGYLVACPAPRDWQYGDWMKFLAFLFAWLAGKLSSSGLKGAQ